MIIKHEASLERNVDRLPKGNPSAQGIMFTLSRRVAAILRHTQGFDRNVVKYLESSSPTVDLSGNSARLLALIDALLPFRTICIMIFGTVPARI